eukprot:gene14096-30812_t
MLQGIGLRGDASFLDVRKTATTQCKVRSVDTILDRCIKTMAKAKAERIKLVMVGDEAVGKSCLLTGYTDNIFSSKYEPTVFVTHTAYIKNEEGDQVEIAVFDTAGREEYDGMRPGLAYSGPNSKSDADVFLICYSIGNPGSLLEATEKWAPELEQHCPGMAAKGQKHVLPNEAQTTADKLGLTAAECLECSAKEKAGVLEIFQMATKTALSYKAASKSRRQNRVFRSIKQRLTGSFRSGGGSIEDPEKLRLRKAAQAVKAKLKEEEEAEKARAKKLIAKEKSEKARLKTEAATFAKAEKEAKAVWKAMYAAASPAEKVRMKEAAAEKEWLKTATPAQIKRRKKEKAADAAAAAAREEYLSRADSTRASASDATVEAPVAGADATYYQIPAAAPQDYEYPPALLPVDSSSNATPVQLGCSTEPETANIPRYMREHLGLSPQDAEMYCAVWGAVESKEGSFVGGAKVFKLFSAAGVVNENRDAIWRLANKSIKGRLVEKEFYVALKLVALHQLDPGMDFNNLTDDPTAVLARTGIPLPQLGALMPSPIEPQQEPIYDEAVVHEPIHVAAAVVSDGEEDDDDEHDYNLIGDIDPAEMEAFASNVSRVSKYVAPSLRLGRPKQVALGLENLIGVDTDLANTINAMKEGRILQEFEEHGTDEDKGNLKHVLAGTYRKEWGRSKAASVAAGNRSHTAIVCLPAGSNGMSRRRSNATISTTHKSSGKEGTADAPPPSLSPPSTTSTAAAAAVAA